MSDSCVYNNTGVGIIAQTACTVTSCDVAKNGSDGIKAGANSLISGNNCHENFGGCGINAIASGARIEGNTCSSNNRGIQCAGGGNIVFRNTCSGNSLNWLLVANNIYGPIINRSGASTAVVNGDSATSTLGSTDANANFTY